MLAVLNGSEPHHEWLRHGGVETLDSYGFTGDLDFLPDSHAEFYANLGDYYVDGEFFFTHAAYDPKTPLENQPPHMLRWHSLRDGLPGPHLSGKTAIVGHTANREGEILDVGHLRCIDTCCYAGGVLTAVEPRLGLVWQATKAGEIRTVEA